MKAGIFLIERKYTNTTTVFGYSLLINGKYLMLNFDGYSFENIGFCDRLEGAAAFGSIKLLRKYWNKYQQLIIATAKTF